MYVFGIDIPLVEIFFVMAVFVVAMIIMLVYLITRVRQINAKIQKLGASERLGMRGILELKNDMEGIKDETEQDICLLSNIKDELDKVLKNSWRGVIIEKKGLKKIHRKVKRKIKEKKKRKKRIEVRTRLPPMYDVSYITKYKEQPKRIVKTVRVIDETAKKPVKRKKYRKKSKKSEMLVENVIVRREK
jgi:hypothetical protein